MNFPEDMGVKCFQKAPLLLQALLQRWRIVRVHTVELRKAFCKRGLPTSPLGAKTASIFHTVRPESYQISGCRRQIISAALWRMHCWGCPVTQREKGKFLPPQCLSVSVRPICHPLPRSSLSRLGTATLPKALWHTLIKQKHGLMEGFSFFIFL